MINPDVFVEGLVQRGYTHVCAVPCSFARYLINALIENEKIEYIACASEAVAASVCAGLVMAGSKAIMVIQSSGLTNAASCLTTLVIPYKVYFPIIVSKRTYVEGDSEIQHQLMAEKLEILLNEIFFDKHIFDDNNLERNLDMLDEGFEKPLALILKKDSFNIFLTSIEKLNHYPLRSKYLAALETYVSQSDFSVIGTTGNLSRELHYFTSEINAFYMAGNMGGVLSVGLGVALAGKKIIVCGGDAESVMHLGGAVTAGRYTSMTGKLIYIIFDNEVNKSTGGQPSYQQHVDYINLFSSVGFSVFNEKIDKIEKFIEALKWSGSISGPVMMHVKCGLDDETARPSLQSLLESRNAFKGN